ncbi:hypothetical protein BGX27_001775 [Mortierella sp. AM989]|nr:hypothetical protein BGX27_001775 [Mortierella sp. AM989]
MSSAVITGIVFAVIIGIGGCTYLCCFRKEVTMRETQKLMDATNLMHAQEPQGTVSPALLPDGTMGLLVRPLAPDASMLPISAGTPIPINVYSQQHQPSQTAYHFAAPSAPPASPLPHHHLALGLSAHPRPAVVTTLNDESLDGNLSAEVKGTGGNGRWEPRPFVPPGRSSIISNGTPGISIDLDTSKSVWQSGGLRAPSSILGHDYSQNVTTDSTELNRRNPQEGNPNDSALVPSAYIPFNPRSFPEMDPRWTPSRQPLNPHEPVVSQQ